MGYPPYGYNLYPQMAPTMPQNQQAQNGMIWVAGEMDARNYPVCPNAAVTLWDSTAPVVYIKSADQTGRPSIKTYDLVERVQAPQPVSAPATPQVTREEFEALAAKVAALAPKSKKKEEEA